MKIQPSAGGRGCKREGMVSYVEFLCARARENIRQQHSRGRPVNRLPNPGECFEDILLLDRAAGERELVQGTGVDQILEDLVLEFVDGHDGG